MGKKAPSGIILMLLLVGTLALAFNVQLAKAENNIGNNWNNAGLQSLAQPDVDELLAERVGFGRNASGGLGGDFYYVTSLADSGAGSLRAGAESVDPLWIVFNVSGTIHLNSKIQVKSNKTIDGRGAEITITGYDFNIKNVSNIIVTNLVFDTAGGDNLDGIRIYNCTHDVWVHHCSFTNWTDGCLDITEASTDVTVSWCKFYNHNKVMLIGADPNATGDVVIRVTLHHNFFNGTNQRHPRLRFGKVDAYNNYLYNWGLYGMRVTMYGQLLIEANIFEAGAAKSAVSTYEPAFDPESGYSKLVDNLLLNGAEADENGPEQVFDRSTYYTATIETADNALKLKILAGAGAVAPKREGTLYPWSMFHHDLNNTGYTESLAPTKNRTLWIAWVGNVAAGGPTVADGLVFVGGGSTVFALNMTTGAYVWAYSTGDTIRSAPAVADGLVFICSNDGNIYALHEDTGLKVWNQTTYDPDTGNPIKLERIHPAVHGGKVFYGGYDGNLTCRNATTGELVWNYTTGDTVRGCPAVFDGRVYVGSANDQVYCLNETTGEKLWNYTTEGDVRGSIAVFDGKVFFGSQDDTVYCLDMYTGAKLWNYTTGGDIFSSPAVHGGKVFIGSFDWNVFALNMTTGEELWNYTTGYKIEYASPAVAGGLVFIGSTDDVVYCLNENTGELVWSYRTGGDIRGSPAVADGFVFVGAFDGFMYAFGAFPHGPVASFAFSPANPLPGENVAFNASASSPGWNGTHDVPIANYTWDFGDGNVTTVDAPTTTVNHVYSSVGTFTVNLTVMCEDNPALISEGLTSNSAWKSVNVIPPSTPVASFAVSPPPYYANVTVVSFDASGSEPGFNGIDDVPIANYTWDFGDGNVTTVDAPMATVTHVYSSVGTFAVNLTVICEYDPTLIAEGLTANSTWKNITVTVLVTVARLVVRTLWTNMSALVGADATISNATYTVSGITNSSGITTFSLGPSLYNLTVSYSGVTINQTKNLNVAQDMTVTITTDPAPYELIATLKDTISNLQSNITDLQSQINSLQNQARNNLYIGIGGGSIIGLFIGVAAVLFLRKKR